MRNKVKHQVLQIINVDDQNYLPSKVFDILIIFLIIINVVIIILESCSAFPEAVVGIFDYIEIISVTVFTIEYLLRLWTADLMYPMLPPIRARVKYLCSFMSIVDLVAILPFYIPFILPVDLMILRTLRLIRLVRVFKVNRYTKALAVVGNILKEKTPQLISSLLVVFVLMLISAVLMYNCENEAQPQVFTNIFSGLWWAVATFTTVGYGDIYPITAMGKILSAIISILGIGLIAIPTGIISAGFIEKTDRNSSFSTADEILKYKNLLDIGVITAAEFQEKKKRLLDL